MPLTVLYGWYVGVLSGASEGEGSCGPTTTLWWVGRTAAIGAFKRLAAL